jgi:hypothetical protein
MEGIGSGKTKEMSLTNDLCMAVDTIRRVQGSDVKLR